MDDGSRYTQPLSNGLPPSRFVIPSGRSHPSQPCLCSPFLRLSLDAREHDGLANDCRTIAPRYAWTFEGRYSHSDCETNVNVFDDLCRRFANLHNLQISVVTRIISENIALSLGNWSDLKLIIISQKLSVARYVITSHLSMLDIIEI